MKTKYTYKLASLCLLAMGLAPNTFAAIDDGNTVLSIQGQLVPGTPPVIPPRGVDMTFTLFNATSGGTAIAGPITNLAVAVNTNNGLFTAFPNFGSNLDNSHSYWMEIGVRTNDSDLFTTLSPRLTVTPAPQAYYAGSAGVAAVAMAATNFVGLVAGDVSGPQGATVVSSVGGQTAANIASATVAANSATSVSTAGAIVARDGSGSFSADSVTLGGSLYLPFPAIIYSGTNTVFVEEGSLFVGGNAFFPPSTYYPTTGSGASPQAHDVGIGDSVLSSGSTGQFNTGIGELALQYNTSGSNNTAGGFGALRDNTTGSYNKADGYQALYSNTTGSWNTANGSQALYSNTAGYGNEANGYEALNNNTTGYNNSADGYQALFSNTTGFDNVASGWQSLYGNTTGWFNTADGIWALRLNTTGNNNTAAGYDALGNNLTGTLNTAAGVHALLSNSSGSNNVAVGADSLNNVQTGANNIAVGSQAGINFAGSESLNIDLGNPGVLGDTNTIRIGTSTVHNNAYLAGIYGVTTASNAMLVVVDSSGHLGTASGGSVGVGNLSTTNISLGGLPNCPNQDGVLNLPVTSDTGGMLAGAITLGGCGQLFLHAYGVNDFFGGLDAGNLTLTGTDNTGLGFESLSQNTSGYVNTAVGSQSLFNNTTGFANTAIGYQALFSNTSGYDNVASGWQSLLSNTTGWYNTADGIWALRNNTTGDDNTASGYNALGSNATGRENTGDGVHALHGNLSGSQNVAVGWWSMNNVQDGTNDIAVGYQAGINFSGSESGNIDIGSPGVAGDNNAIRIGIENVQTNAYVAGIFGTATASNAMLVVVDSSGHLGTASGGSVGVGNLSTTNISLGGLPNCPNQDGVLNLPVTSDTGGMLAGAITLGGCGQLFLHAYGANNFFGGLDAGNLTLTGTDNTGLGFESLSQNTSGYVNTAVGSQSLFNNTTGFANTAIGYQALFSNTSGYDNVASGWQSLLSNTTGWYNTADGIWALRNNTTGDDNTASGYNALGSNATGRENTGDGVHALHGNLSGSQNVAVGWWSMNNVQDGTNDIAVGYQAGINFSGSESGNIDIGNPGVAGDNHAIRIGTDDIVNSNSLVSTYVAGIYDSTVIGVPVYAQADGKLGTLQSSARYKQNIQTMADASDVLLSLRPVKYQYKPGIDPKGRPQFGLVAEEVDKIDPDLVVHDELHGIYTVRYEAVNAMLLNEFLKQHEKVEAQNTEIESLKAKAARVDSLESRLDELQALVHQLAVQK